MVMVKLRNGSEELKILVNAIHLNLQAILTKHPISFYDLVTLARDKNYKIFPPNAKCLIQLGLLNEGQPGEYHMHDSIKSIILSSVEGDMLDMKLVDPIIKD